MSTFDQTRPFRVALKIGAAQCAVAVAAAVVWLAFGGAGPALAALTGGATPALLSLFVGGRLALTREDLPPQGFVAVFLRTQAMKFVLAVGLLAFGVYVFSEQFPALITTLALALAVHWFALLWLR